MIREYDWLRGIKGEIEGRKTGRGKKIEGRKKRKRRREGEI
jgi:hypothetical protein